MIRKRIQAAARRTFFRYLPSEIAGTLTALAGAAAAYAWSGSLILAAISGSIGEAIGYYGIAALREFRLHHESPKRRKRAHWATLTTAATLRSLVLEYGPAESIDSLFVRPFLFYIIPRATGTTWLGWLVAKFCADIVFYVLIAISYELRKKRQL